MIAHGVSATMNQLCQERGVAVQTLTSPSGHSSRYTPPELRDLYVEAAEMANARVVAELRSRGADALGFVGDAVVVSGRRKTAIRALVEGRTRIIRDDHSGSIVGVDSGRLEQALKQARIPTLPPMAQSDDGLLNVDGDRAAAAVAGGLNAQALVILSNVGGLYRHFPDETSMIGEVPWTRIDDALEWAQGRMKRKVLAAKEALANGVEQVIIADGRVKNAITLALKGAGTRFAND